jgi:hypothetical protein
LAVYFGNAPGEPGVVVAWRIIAMLMFYLPIIIFEVMLETQRTSARPSVYADWIGDDSANQSIV